MLIYTIHQKIDQDSQKDFPLTDSYQDVWKLSVHGKIVDSPWTLPRILERLYKLTEKSGRKNFIEVSAENLKRDDHA